MYKLLDIPIWDISPSNCFTQASMWYQEEPSYVRRPRKSPRRCYTALRGCTRNSCEAATRGGRVKGPINVPYAATARGVLVRDKYAAHIYSYIYIYTYIHK